MAAQLVEKFVSCEKPGTKGFLWVIYLSLAIGSGRTSSGSKRAQKRTRPTTSQSRPVLNCSDRLSKRALQSLLACPSEVAVFGGRCWCVSSVLGFRLELRILGNTGALWPRNVDVIWKHMW